jgi:hypothetical protein
MESVDFFESFFEVDMDATSRGRDLFETLSQLLLGLLVWHSPGLVSEPSASYQLVSCTFPDPWAT